MSGELFTFVAESQTLNIATMKKITAKMERQGIQMETDRETFALALKTWRLRAGKTQRQVAEEWGVSRFTIIKAETAKPIAWETAYRIFAQLSKALEEEK